MQQITSRTVARPGIAGGLVLREVLVPGAFVLAILLSSYALSGLPNVKLFDLLVFVAGYSLGLRRGALVAVVAWLVYGQINPWGVAQAPLLMTLMTAEVGYAVAGSVVRILVPIRSVRLGPSRMSLALLAAALVATSAYDLATNLYTAYFWAGLAGSTDYSRWIRVTLFGPGALFFMAVHVGSNAVLFPVFGPLLVKGTERAKGAFGWR